MHYPTQWVQTIGYLRQGDEQNRKCTVLPK